MLEVEKNKDISKEELFVIFSKLQEYVESLETIKSYGVDLDPALFKKYQEETDKKYEK